MTQQEEQSQQRLSAIQQWNLTPIDPPEPSDMKDSDFYGKNRQLTPD